MRLAIAEVDGSEIVIKHKTKNDGARRNNNNYNTGNWFAVVAVCCP